ncbi:hypothetical protein ACLOJK_014700 [Asimina triloba]
MDVALLLLIDGEEEEEPRMPLISFALRTLLPSPQSSLLSRFGKGRRRFALLPVDAGINEFKGGRAAGGEGEALPEMKMLLEIGCCQTRFALVLL